MSFGYCAFITNSVTEPEKLGVAFWMLLKNMKYIIKKIGNILKAILRMP